MEERCRVCERIATRRLANYSFCEEHFEKANHQRQGVWKTNLLTIGLMVLFVVIVYAVDAVVKPVFSGVALPLAGMLLSLIPAGLWLAFFYRMDRLEPEPRSMVLGVFLLGALLAAAIGIPLTDSFFGVGRWIYQSGLVQILGGILVIGFVQEFLKYAAVRFSVYSSNEFDERTDGIIYSTAAGLGFATALNVMFVIASGGVDLGNGVIRITITALAQASFSGVVGYFLAREKLEGKPAWWMPMGVAIAATLNGLFFFLRGRVQSGSLSGGADFLSTWAGLALAAVLAGGVTYLLSWLIRRDQQVVFANKEA